MAEHTPRSLIVTLYGAYGRGRTPGDEPLPIAALIRLLGAVEVDPPSVRSAVSRLKRRGLLAPARTADGAAGYVLSEGARQLLDDGDRRIFGRRPPRLADGWVLAVFSVPEHERNKRHLLRSRLARLGFGTAAPGVWIAPAHLLEETRHTLGRLELAPYVDLFTGSHTGFEPTPGAVARWWDLDAIAKLHQAFLDEHEPMLRRWTSRRTTDREEAYRDHLLMIDSWRHVPYADPGLAPELLPADWPGARSAEVFTALHARLRTPATAYARSVLSAA
ncbi:PaaX family transcriptional regulator C-terminal domain-containing protein [Streptomyces sp. NPDC048639]|uniref:PaaX family transcriptional regulator n=1 Tax=Streptomyces sp. NPDC048639 TaxID=3365581 RepID=UPI003722814B